MRKFLKRIGVIQEVSNDDRHKKGLKRLGRGFSKAHRLNPYNPLSYFTAVIVLIIGIILFGVWGVWEQMKPLNPFKWD